MLDRIRKIFDEKRNRADFFSVVERYFPKGSDDYIMVERAYSTAKDAFKYVQRDGGDRYFEHLRGVTLIIMVYLRIRDTDVICAALLHDIVEDVDSWTQERLTLHFNQNISEYVWWVSKTPVERFHGDKEARNRAYHQNLNRAPRRALIIKLADRLHNLLTLWDCTDEKQRKKVQETQDFYLPIAESEIMLIHEIEAAINEIRLSWQEK